MEACSLTPFDLRTFQKLFDLSGLDQATGEQFPVLLVSLHALEAGHQHIHRQILCR